MCYVSYLSKSKLLYKKIWHCSDCRINFKSLTSVGWIIRLSSLKSPWTMAKVEQLKDEKITSKKEFTYTLRLKQVTWSPENTHFPYQEMMVWCIQWNLTTYLSLVCFREEYFFPARIKAFPLHLLAELLMLCIVCPRWKPENIHYSISIILKNKAIKILSFLKGGHPNSSKGYNI